MSLVYYHFPKSSAERTTWAVEELSVPCERVLVDFRKGATRTPDFMRLNPNGKIPVLVVDGRAIFESLAILIYLGETYGEKDGLYPPAGVERAECLKWMVWATASLLEGVQRYVAHTSEHVPAEQRSASAAAGARNDLERMLAILDGALADQGYLVGGRFTLADLAVCGFMPYFQFVGYQVSHYSHISAWADRCFARPAAHRALGI